MKNILEYNELVIRAAEILRVMPGFLKRSVLFDTKRHAIKYLCHRLIGPYIGKHATVQDIVFNNMINDLVTQRMNDKKLAKTGEISSPPPVISFNSIV